MFCLILQGGFAGQCIFVANTNAAQGVTDGWAKDLKDEPYPYDASGVDRTVTPGASYDAWVDAGSPARDPIEPEPPPPVTASFSSISNANPAVIAFTATGYGKFADGNVVTISGTGNVLVDGLDFTLGNGVSPTYELAGLDLSAEVAPLGGGTATLKV